MELELTVSDLHNKFIKIFIWVAIVNLAIAVFNTVLVYNDIADGKYGMAVFHLVVVAVNTWVVWHQVKNVKRVKQDAKDQVWAILSDKEIA